MIAPVDFVTFKTVLARFAASDATLFGHKQSTRSPFTKRNASWIRALASDKEFEVGQCLLAPLGPPHQGSLCFKSCADLP